MAWHPPQACPCLLPSPPWGDAGAWPPGLFMKIPHKSPGTHSLPFRYTEPGIPAAAPSQQSSSCATAAKDVCGGRWWTSRKSKALTRGQGQWSMLSRIRIKKKHSTIVQWLFTNLLFPVLSPYTVLRGPAAFVFTRWFWLSLPLHHLPVTEPCIHSDHRQGGQPQPSPLGPFPRGDRQVGLRRAGAEPGTQPLLFPRCALLTTPT